MKKELKKLYKKYQEKHNKINEYKISLLQSEICYAKIGIHCDFSQKISDCNEKDSILFLNMLQDLKKLLEEEE